jgi:hypothetical protein
VTGLNWKKLASQWNPLDRFVITASRMFSQPLLTFFTMIGLVTVVVVTVELTTVVVVTIVVVVVEVRVVVDV